MAMAFYSSSLTLRHMESVRRASVTSLGPRDHMAFF